MWVCMSVPSASKNAGGALPAPLDHRQAAPPRGPGSSSCVRWRDCKSAAVSIWTRSERRRGRRVVCPRMGGDTTTSTIPGFKCKFPFGHLGQSAWLPRSAIGIDHDVWRQEREQRVLEWRRLDVEGGGGERRIEDARPILQYAREALERVLAVAATIGDHITVDLLQESIELLAETPNMVREKDPTRIPAIASPARANIAHGSGRSTPSAERSAGSCKRVIHHRMVEDHW